MNPSRHFEHIVIGTGSMGAATCWQLARRGKSVLGIDRFEVPHGMGSHGGETRIIRKAYYEHPDYIPLLQAAYRGWEELEEESGERLYFSTGLLYAGPKESSILQGVLHAAEKYDITLQRLAWSDTPSSRFSVPPEYDLLFEPDAGYLAVDLSLRSLIACAARRGAEFLTDTQVIAWKEQSGVITVTTEKEEFTCDKLIITSGAWTGSLLPALSDKLTVTRQVLAWYAVKKPGHYELGEFPCWLIAENGLPGPYYGFPSTGSAASGQVGELKVAYHHRGLVTDPDSILREVTAEETQALDAFVRRTFREVSATPVRTSVCLYVNSPDDHFIIDRQGPVAYACGFSGHGFKFVPAIGAVLADLSMYGKTPHPIGFLSVKRFG